MALIDFDWNVDEDVVEAQITITDIEFGNFAEATAGGSGEALFLEVFADATENSASSSSSSWASSFFG